MPKKNSTPAAQRSPDLRPLRLLVAWHPRSDSAEAIEFAAWLGRSIAIRVRVVTTVRRPWPSSSLSRIGGKYQKWLKKQSKSCAQQVKEGLIAAGLERTQWDNNYSVLLEGPSETFILAEAAKDFDADVLILGSSAAAPKGRFLAGSTADALLHSSPTALGLAPRRPKLSKRGVTRINFAYLSAESEQDHSALRYAAQSADRWELPLRLLAFSTDGLTDSVIHDQLDLGQDLSVEWREHSLAMLDRARDWVLDQFPDLHVETDFASGAGWSGAVDAVKWKKGDLLCLGSHPVGALERVFLGSTASSFLPYAPVPVLVYPVHNPAPKVSKV
ncbi:universal stress protein [Corynebacterium poyangense]|uniref:Universal stress protein n=1 Tax=Corynebacterium poyangense TaxID=2684405 RepID=A0A7H0SRV6_9CORY|nr:universal stress protein [Corynebacterium poyangense]MBZ8177221.1 universal stress protein [Corynebacterium poyangense]QNQ91281.1 universal stress protein [Corynebacterium poyangense]